MEGAVDTPLRATRLLDQVAIAYGYQWDIASDDTSVFYYAHWAGHRTTTHEIVIVERVWYALAELRECTESHPDKLSGVPVLRGTRFTLAQLLAELADGRNTQEIADAFTIEATLIERFLYGLSAYLNRPV